jgi:hypothetical protein
VAGGGVFVGKADLRREEMRSFTVGAAPCSAKSELEKGVLECDFECSRRGSDIRFDEFELVAGDNKDGWTVLCGFVYCGVKRFFGMEEVCKKRNTSKCSMLSREEEVSSRVFFPRNFAVFL